jgi:hypothetical protein
MMVARATVALVTIVIIAIVIALIVSWFYQNTLFESIWNKTSTDIWETFSQSFQENSINWLVISTVLVGILTAVIKFLSEQYIPQQRIKKARKIAIQKYSYPLFNSAFSLARQINDLILGNEGKLVDPNDDLYRLKVLYYFGCFLGWCRILDREAFTEYSEQKETLVNKKIQRFYAHYGLTLKGLISNSYFAESINFKGGLENLDMYKKGDYMSDYNDDRNVGKLINKETAYVEPLAITAIGDLMIKKVSEKKEDKLPDLISLVEFAHDYENSTDFKRWFRYLEKMMEGLTDSPTDAKRNRLLIFLCYLTIFEQFIAVSNFRFMSIYIWNIVRYYLSPIQYYKRAKRRIATRGKRRRIDSEYISLGMKDVFLAIFWGRPVGHKSPHYYIKWLHPIPRQQFYQDVKRLGYSRQKVNAMLNYSNNYYSGFE